MTETSISLSILKSLNDISAQDWDSCANWSPDGGFAENPFLTHRFLLALEHSGSVGDESGWLPHYLVLNMGQSVIGVAPMYLKYHSQGEYIFDHSWAHAYERAGGQYYPKLQIAAPFTPATGRRLLAHPDFQDIAPKLLARAAADLAENNGISSVHATFCDPSEYDAAPDWGYLQRETQQFHWLNQGYFTFDDFLNALSSRKRKNIRKERQTAQNFGGDIVQLHGDDIKPHHWDAFWEFYQDTGARKWGSPYLTRDFFDIAHETMRQDMVLVLAQDNGQPIAGALNFIGQDALFGRYWGCTRHHACLHFELCYYQAIDFAIEHKLARVEAGAQGEHKLARGYLPQKTYSMHWIADQGFCRAVNEYLAAERDANAQDMDILTSYGPFKNHKPEEQD